MDKNNKKTYVINIIGGPGIGKTTIAAGLFYNFKSKSNKCVEYVQEYAKTLVWTEKFNALNNQYAVSEHQFELLKSIKNKVDIIITDGPLLIGLYFNRHYKNNVSNIDKTEKFILESFSQFNNINIVLERGDYEYEHEGREQSEEESKEIDVILKNILRTNNIEYTTFKSDATEENINLIVQYILNIINKK
jgi:uridine kinase